MLFAAQGDKINLIAFFHRRQKFSPSSTSLSSTPSKLHLHESGEVMVETIGAKTMSLPQERSIATLSWWHGSFAMRFARFQIKCTIWLDRGLNTFWVFQEPYAPWSDDGFMCFLRVFRFGFINAGLCRYRIFAISLFDECSNFTQCFVGKIYWVGTHIGD